MISQKELENVARRDSDLRVAVEMIKVIERKGRNVNDVRSFIYKIVDERMKGHKTTMLFFALGFASFILLYGFAPRLLTFVVMSVFFGISFWSWRKTRKQYDAGYQDLILRIRDFAD